MAAVLPVLPAYPVEVAAETLLVVGIEIKLVAELHEAYGILAPGNFAERMSAYVAAWAHRRGVFMIEGGLILAAGSPLARLLRGGSSPGSAAARSPWARCLPAPPRAPCSTAGRPESSAGTSGATCAAARSATEGGHGHIGSLRSVSGMTERDEEGPDRMGELDGLAARYEASRPRLRAVAYRMLGSASEADDAIQEAWLHVSRSAADGVENLNGWLMTVVARVCLDMLRSRKSRREDH